MFETNLLYCGACAATRCKLTHLHVCCSAMVKITANATAVQGFSNVLLSEAAAPLQIDYNRAIQKIKDSKANLNLCRNHKACRRVRTGALQSSKFNLNRLKMLQGLMRRMPIVFRSAVAKLRFSKAAELVSLAQGSSCLSPASSSCI